MALKKIIYNFATEHFAEPPEQPRQLQVRVYFQSHVS